MDVQKYMLPDSWAVYLINGDESGYDPCEITMIDQWLLRTFPSNTAAWCVDVDSENDSEFMRYHDARNVMPLAAGCLEYTFHVYPAS